MSRLAINRVAFLGRTLAEYVRMFDLTPDDLAAAILGNCGPLYLLSNGGPLKS